jgi:hypothetical protein
MSPPARIAPSRALEHHSPLARAVLIGIGLVFALSFAALALLVLSWLSIERWPLLLVAAFLAGLSAYGGWLFLRGVRGDSGRRFERAQRYYDRYAVAVLPPVGLVLFVVLQPTSLTPLWFVSTGLFVIPLHVAIHELSHVLAGHLVGFRFDSMAVGPLLISREAGAFSIAWTRLALHSGVDGWAKVTVREASNPRLCMALFAAGGPLGNLVTAVLALSIQWALGNRMGEGHTYASALLDALFVWGLVPGLGNLLPVQLPGTSLASDGAVLLRLARASRIAPEA